MHLKIEKILKNCTQKLSPSFIQRSSTIEIFSFPPFHQKLRNVHRFRPIKCRCCLSCATFILCFLSICHCIGAACHKFTSFHYSVHNPLMKTVKVMEIKCTQPARWCNVNGFVYINAFFKSVQWIGTDVSTNVILWCSCLKSKHTLWKILSIKGWM